MLDSIQSAALRLALGVLGTSPTLSLCAEAGVPPLQFRFLSLTANFLASTAQFPQIPILLPSLCPQNSLRLFLESQLSKRLRLKPLPPIYSSSPPWTLTLPDIRLDLTASPRSHNSTYYRGNNSPPLLFIPIPLKSQKIFLGPVSPLLRSLQQL